jgi:hypothetical protein
MRAAASARCCRFATDGGRAANLQRRDGGGCRRARYNFARRFTREAVETLVAIMRNEKATDTARALAANSILDRGHGRPAQSIDVGVNRKSVEE